MRARCPAPLRGVAITMTGALIATFALAGAAGPTVAAGPAAAGPVVAAVDAALPPPISTQGPCGYTSTPDDPAVRPVPLPPDPRRTPNRGTVTVIVETNHGLIPLTPPGTGSTTARSATG